MTIHYVDPAATGANNGTSWTNAWTTLQTAADTATAGDTVYCRGTQNISAAIDFDTNSGTYDGGYIKFIGCNASGNNDGTRFTLKRTSNTIDGIYANAVHFVWLENISVEDCTGTAGINCAAAYADYWALVNVRSHNNSGIGIRINAYGRYWHLSRCKCTSNGGDGVYRPLSAQFAFCEFSGNTGNGVSQSAINSYFNCIFRNNAGYGVDLYAGGLLANCVVDANTAGGVKVSHTLPVANLIGCRITNHTSSGKFGVDVTANVRCCLIGCYFGNNATDITAGRYDIVPINGSTAHVVLGGSETDHGYVSPGSPNYDFNLDATKAADTRSIAVPLP
jgi:hypothetical protein